MNKLIIAGVVLLLLAVSCKKAEQLQYHSHDNVYFDLPADDRDSIVYTFAYYPGRSQDTIFLPVRISGIRMPEGRPFNIQVIDTASTAVAGTHYEPFQSFYTMPAGSGIYRLPVVIYNKDESLVARTVAITVQLTAGDAFGVELPRLIRARMIMSNKLEKPKWWEMWLGDYSQVKHLLFRLSVTKEDLRADYQEVPKSLFYIGKFTSFLADPITWVESHPETGYVTKPRPDGNYDFYHTGTPDKTILLRKKDATGNYYFIDENGNEVM